MSGDLSGLDLDASGSQCQSMSMHYAPSCQGEQQAQISRISRISLPDDGNLSRDDRWRYMSRSVRAVPMRPAAVHHVQTSA